MEYLICKIMRNMDLVLTSVTV